MCWKCGAFRPYDMPPVFGVERIGYMVYMLDGVEYTAVDYLEKDPEKILELIDDGYIVSLEDWEYGIGWDDLCKYPPLDSGYFTRKISASQPEAQQPAKPCKPVEGAREL